VFSQVSGPKDETQTCTMVEVHTGHVRLDALADVLAPLMDGAACVDERELFDATINGSRGSHDAVSLARIQAMQVCESCAALGDCRTWYDSLRPDQRPYGVVGGRLSSRRVPGQKRAG
jgi:hypothetical protein